ncbi:hypothetical protein PUNSTDRAFT_139441 [Punctularia strigosozonata HHB-11173 SS5]|uniref:Uncharacterized protein n=1 Tax=Punctularia strigosozonata (strain HHB-11173) TaxID=741275 RepID=R7RZL6_PUNST|nr:uncharacterized protein PUNSTDRAFT_139441 [Punctularia strigosozonata HHB-11173 SS5]EIN03560.1 hypothetical protein PUNSTDRAFT_139441 [Punctularia strigosozonata HHB-11173 SS5]
MLSFILVALDLRAVFARANEVFPTLVNITNPLALAVQPVCGSLSSANYTEVNAGISLNTTKTVVAFANGTVPVPPVLWPPLPSAGSRTSENRRASNGYIWVENLATSLSAKLLDYAWGGAVIDRAAWNTTRNVTQTARTDFNDEMRLFFVQGTVLDPLTPETTLYTVAFGIKYGLL